MDLGKLVRTIPLCGGEKCCPSLRIYASGAGAVLINDDGGMVSLTLEQTKELRDLLNKEFPK